MAEINLICKNCGISFFKKKGEYNRQIRNGKTNFFCDLTCSALYNGKAVYAEKQCPHCKTFFETKISNTKTNKTFCSRECASAGSITEARREAGRSLTQNFPSTVEHAARSLRSREGWKYVDVEKFLSSLNIEHVFEFIIENYIYDLALIDKKIIFEFDGDNHIYDVNEIAKDKLKEKLANENGWQLVRISVENSTKIKPSLLIQYIESSSRKSEY